MASLLPAVRRGRGLPTYAAVVLGFMILVILWGAVVRATGSGAGCGDHWPLCNGDFFPHHPRLATLIEFTHRSMSGICTFLVAALVAWTFLARPAGHRARKAAVASAALLLTEALLGAVLVLGGYVDRNASDMRVLMQCIHFSNTMLLLAALTLTWWWLRGALPESSASRPTRSLSWIALLTAMLTGATGSVAALADTLFPSPSLRIGIAQDFASAAPILVRMRWLHPAAALLATAAALTLCLHLRRAASRWIFSLVLLQIALGFADLLALAPVSLQILHLLGADLFWIALVAACSEVLSFAHGRRPAHQPALP